MKQHLFAVLLAASLAGPVLAETMTIQEALSGKTLPLALKLKDLDETWRRVDVGGAADAASPTAIYRAMLSGQTSGGAFFTKGQTITIDSAEKPYSRNAPRLACGLLPTSVGYVLG
jgi:hypothetical protein